jgi:hypothetical protein
MAFLEKSDLTSIINADDLDAITEGEDSIITGAINAAIDRAKKYLSRFDTDALFNATGDARDFDLLEICKSLAMPIICKSAAPNQNIKDIKKAATDAKRDLEKMQDGTIPTGWPLKSDPKISTFFHVVSNPKRRNNI